MRTFTRTQNYYPAGKRIKTHLALARDSNCSVLWKFHRINCNENTLENYVYHCILHGQRKRQPNILNIEWIDMVIYVMVLHPIVHKNQLKLNI